MRGKLCVVICVMLVVAVAAGVQQGIITTVAGIPLTSGLFGVGGLVQRARKPTAVARESNWAAARSRNQARPGQTLPAAARAQIVASYGKLPLSFEANDGQAGAAVKFLSRGGGYTLFLTSTEAVLTLRHPSRDRERADRTGAKKNPQIPQISQNQKQSAPSAKSADENAVLRMKLVGANPVSRSSGLEELPGKVNYFIGNDPNKWRRNVRTYAKVRYEGVYPGVDLVYYGSQRQLEYDFVVAPGADASAIGLAFAGAQGVEIDPQGDLTLQAPAGEVRLRKPTMYQQVGGIRKAVDGRYVWKGKQAVGFEVASYDRRHDLIIDPVLTYSTYLGGSGSDNGNAIAVDSLGNAYVTGGTTSTNFPIANAQWRGGNRNAGLEDAFVTKLNTNASGSTSLVYSTYLGSGGDDEAFGIAVDSSGNAYVAGFANLLFPTWPVVGGCLAGGAFVAKLNATGNDLLYSDCLGETEAFAIAVDSSGNAYVTGATLVSRTRFDAFVAKIDPNAGDATLVYSTHLGSTGDQLGYGIAVDSSGSAYVTGETNSSNFPTTANAFQASLGGPLGVRDAFVTKLDAAGKVVYSTYLGGSDLDLGTGIAVDSSGNAYVTGTTTSSNFPTTANAFQASSPSQNSHAFVTKINATGSALLYSTYLGGSGGEIEFGIAVDCSGNAYVTGVTDSSNFPRTADAFQTSNGGRDDAFVTKINATGSALLYSTYLGGSGDDEGHGIAVDSAGNTYVTGRTDSSNFPMANAYRSTYGGGTRDAFVTKIPVPAANICPTSCSYSISPISDRLGLTRSHGTGVESGTVSVTAPGGCNWTATSDEAWITITSGASGSGNGTVSYSVAANPAGDGRFGALAIAGHLFFIGQAGVGCNFSISPSSRSHGSGVESDTVSLTVPEGCRWFASSNAPWITITDVGSSARFGSGTLSYSVAANPDTSPRTGTLNVADKTFTITQAGVVCNYSIYPTSRSHGSGVESGTVSVTAPGGCNWTASSNAPWITITSGASGSGNGTVSYSLVANSGGNSRTGTLTIAGQTFTITQAGVGCIYSISPTSRSHGSGVESDTVSVTASSTGCTWTASSSVPWITITSGSRGSGNGTVRYSVAANPVPILRAGTLTIAGQNFTAAFTVTQTTPPSCSFTISPTSASHGQRAEGGTVTVTAATGCTWTATGNAAWITISSGSSGSGSGTVRYSVAANPDPNSRTATLTIAGQTFSITQAGTAGGEAPLFHSLSITNAASFMPGLTPGSLVTIFGEHLSSVEGIVSASGFPLPTRLGGTSVTVGGTEAPLFTVANVEGSEQINLQVPWEIQGRTTTRVVVNNNGRTAGVEVEVLRAHPGIFFRAEEEGLGAILHGENYSLVTFDRPARKREAVVIYATGLGPVAPAPRTRFPAPAEPLSRTRFLPRVTVSGVPAEVLFSGLAVGFAGLYQVNIVVPANAPSGPAVVIIEVGERSSNPVLIAVQ